MAVALNAFRDLLPQEFFLMSSHHTAPLVMLNYCQIATCPTIKILFLLLKKL